MYGCSGDRTVPFREAYGLVLIGPNVISSIICANKSQINDLAYSFISLVWSLDMFIPIGLLVNGFFD